MIRSIIPPLIFHEECCLNFCRVLPVIARNSAQERRTEALALALIARSMELPPRSMAIIGQIKRPAPIALLKAAEVPLTRRGVGQHYPALIPSGTWASGTASTGRIPSA